MGWLVRLVGAVPPMQWISVALGVLSLSREIFKWMSEHEKTTRDKARLVRGFRQAVKKARIENDTSDVMRHFADLAIMRDKRTEPVGAEDLSDHW